ncbi:MAG TPA: sel1 repeat family protein, partial [Phycisphaerales bacterium]|nr:sel1 repeat family protein [Phycisphaerales bacterium]
MKRLLLLGFTLFTLAAPPAAAANPPSDLRAATAEEVARWKAEASQNDGRASYWLGKAYLNGWTVEPDPNKAFAYFLQSAESLDPKGLNALGYCYQHGIGVEGNPVLGAEYFQKAIELGSVDAKNNL